MTRLALLRHGHTEWNRAGRIQGSTDIPLERQAAADLGKLRLPAPWDRAELVSSPLLRAMETARLVSDRAPKPIEALREMHWGDWEGKRGVDLRADPASGYRDMEHWGWDFAPPQGEPLSDLRDRVWDWVDTLDRDTVAVCHIGVMRVILAVVHGWDFLGDAPFQVKRNRLFVVERNRGWQPWPDTVRLEPR